MDRVLQVDEKPRANGRRTADTARAKRTVVQKAVRHATKDTMQAMTTFVESCLETVAGSAVAAERQSRGRPRARKLLRALADKKNILITTHLHPDPDALASSMAMLRLLRERLPNAQVHVSIKGNVGGGMNTAFTKLGELELIPWDEQKLDSYDGIVLLDTQPLSAACPLPRSIEPTAVIDHHRGGNNKPHCPFCDVRTDVGATSSIVFSYYMELEADITPALGASLLFAIESDLAGAAGTPGELDNIALSSLTLIADTHRLYQMRYVELPQSYYIAYASALGNAVFYDNAMISHIDEIDTPEKPAVMADFLLRFDQAHWALVTAVYKDKLILSLRTNGKTLSAAVMIRRLLRDIGDGGGHLTKAGGYVQLANGSATEIARMRDLLRGKLLRALKIKATRGQRLVPKAG